MNRVRKNDHVVVVTGKDAGKKGNVLKVLIKEDKVLVQGVNIVSVHSKPTQTSEGGIVRKEMPIHISNVALIDPKTGQATKVSYKEVDGKKVRVAKKSGEIIDKE
ncbi:MAG: rplX [Rickettsiaceae bacterium]|jgi:large subunit ribosomal protein L24|nr:rplX [Rickettsiaceae bacterium]